MIKFENLLTNQNIPLLDIAVVSRTAERVTQLLAAISESHGLTVSDIRVICSWNGSAEEAGCIAVPAGLDFEIHLGHEYHFASNINYCINRAKGQVFCICNDDILLDRDTLVEGVRWATKESVGLVGSTLLFPNGKLQHAGVDYDRSSFLPFHVNKGELQDSVFSSSSPQHYPFTTGALIFVKTGLIKRVHMRESFVECGEDIALSIDFWNQFGTFPVIPKTITAKHLEGFTRGKEGKQGTPDNDKHKLKQLIGEMSKTIPKVLMMTEEEGWILHRKCKEIQEKSKIFECSLNDPSFDSDIVYFMHYARFDERLAKGRISVANFTHIVPSTNTERIFREVAKKADHCISISYETTKTLLAMGIHQSKISTIIVGASNLYKPKLVLGIVGRPYGDTRKGEDLVLRLMTDPELKDKLHIISTNSAWNVSTIDVDLQDFYNYIDYLLVTSRFEGGPVPFMEALRCGKLAIAPPIGVIPSFPHESYTTGSYESLKQVILSKYKEKIMMSVKITDLIANLDWEGWVYKHETVFLELLREKLTRRFPPKLSDSSTDNGGSSHLSTTEKVYMLLDSCEYSEANTLLNTAFSSHLLPEALYKSLSTIISTRAHKYGS